MDRNITVKYCRIRYYTLALANLYGIDMETVIPAKKAYNEKCRPGQTPAFETGR